jgi:serine O-acetyltransferase
MNRNELNDRLPGVVDVIVKHISADARMKHLDCGQLPNRQVIVECIEKLRQLVFPGYFGNPELTRQNLPFRIGELVVELSDALYQQVRCCLGYRDRISGEGNADQPVQGHDQEAARIVAAFLDRIPAVRDILATDVQAAFDGDPAAKTTDETIFCYPGLLAISVQRLAHELHILGTPLLPRIMTEYAHSLTGIDIHPGAELGSSFFIDHGTGVVIGETTQIGARVKIYQGVTLGALAPAYGQALRGQKRHPTVEDDVTIYSGATILGGETVIGKGSVIGGNVFITSSVPTANLVSTEPPKLRYRDRRPRSAKEAAQVWADFQI